MSVERRIADGTDAAQIADAAVATWQEIDVVLSPILGQHGVALLYKRSLYLTVRTHPWLTRTHEGAQTAMDLEALRAAVAQQGDAAAGSGASDLLQTFRELLDSLIGPSLTERLLRSVWATSSSGLPAQDTSP